MADFKLNCPHCQQSFETPEETLGQQVNCPSCKGAIKLPDSPASPSAPPPSQPPGHKATRACPFCGEDILVSAVKCKHCGEFLDGRGKQIEPAESKKPGLQVEKDMWKGKPSYLYYFGHFVIGVLLLPLLGFGLLFILYALLDRNTRLYTLTNRRVMCQAGILSRQIHEVGVKDIRNINVRQRALERLFGLGTVDIASAGTAGVEVLFIGIRDPMRTRDLIRREKDEADSRD